MSNPTVVFRSLLVYLLCLPLAIFLGYLLADPTDLRTLGTVGLVLLLLLSPLLLRYHYPLMILSWNVSMVLFFLPGRPQLWMAGVAFSLFMSIAHRTLSRQSQFIKVPQLIWPLVAIAVVILVTAWARGGIGMRILGGESYGGKKYLLSLVAIMGYFALTAYRIPPRRAGLYLALFFLGGLTGSFTDFFSATGGSWIRYIYLLFPPTNLYSANLELGITRFIGFSAASSALFYFLMARYGIRGIFLSRKPLLFIVFVLVCVLGLFGGFRSLVIVLLLTFFIQFFLEGMHRTKLILVVLLTLGLAAGLAVPFATSLPPTFQRALAFLPIPIDPDVRLDAEGSNQWRLTIWKRLLPEVPKYLLLGKGFGMQASEMLLATDRMVQGGENTEWAELAGDYHNGPLSVIIPYGLWGVGALLWFLAAAWSVLYKNYRYGDPSLRVVNAFILANVIARVLMFLFIVGGFETDMLALVGLVGLSVSLNGGVAKPAPKPVTQTEPTGGFAGILPRPRSAFGR
ncbi:MAG: O-antigen ligase family protein [Verrucomicrobia bacterium]|nr:O-antigen ligase family protein [Verrucomicrobiota bacterium]